MNKITDQYWGVAWTYWLTSGGPAEKGPLQSAGPGTISGCLFSDWNWMSWSTLIFQLLEEAYHYKRPKDRQGKSEMFRVSKYATWFSEKLSAKSYLENQIKSGKKMWFAVIGDVKGECRIWIPLFVI